MIFHQPAAPASLAFRLRFPLAALSLAATLFASAAVAQTQPAAAVVAQEPA
ncbi:lytic murein transglycosylase B, partial [Burkholderia pseudomallei]|nr:lytic murein transglycosylase B [Burkholderia pseudomallei]MBF3601161.1 lytic murein transglycosylase B [Burkholderia pseudomallei]MBF3723156.1 lytic murein transglycosylase B [Burkholderia pseudomallei]